MPSYRPTPIAKYIAKQRKKVGLTQAQLAEALEKSQSWLASVERGRHPVDSAMLMKMAPILKFNYYEAFRALLTSQGLPDLPALDEVTEGVLDELRVEPQADEITRVKPRTYSNIEEDAARVLNACLGNLEGRCEPVDVLALVEQHSHAFMETVGLGECDLRLTGVGEVGEDEVAPEGVTYFKNNTFYIGLRSDVREQLERGWNRARFCLGHELGHVALHGKTLIRSQGRAFRDGVTTATQKLVDGVQIYESPEWQANSWAAALLVPRLGLEAYLEECRLYEIDFSLDDFARRMQVSRIVAQIRLEKTLPRLSVPPGPRGG